MTALTAKGSSTDFDSVLVLDFGSQYTQLIARRIRELKVYSHILPPAASVEDIRGWNPKGIVLSGGPSSVYDEGAPSPPPEIYGLGAPVLGICYGMQLMAHQLGGSVARAARREYGPARMIVDDEGDLFRGVSRGDDGGIDVWMSHGDRIETPPTNFIPIAHTVNSPVAAMRDRSSRLFGLQFHPEVYHTPKGMEILGNFLFRICGCKPEWEISSFIAKAVEEIRSRVGEGKVICALSGGVDSTVTAALVQRAVGDRLTCIFVDNGLLREGEADEVVRAARERLGINLLHVPAAERFLVKLKGVADPEEKRRIIGREFIAVFEEEAARLGRVDFLAQGTLYPDVIESTPYRGPSATIKTHHNVGGLPDVMGLKLIEPLKELFKDEVRRLGAELGVPDEILWRHPFPGPGLAVRVLGEVTAERLETLRKADKILQEEISKAGLQRGLWQAFAVLLPVKSVGVMGDQRTFENVAAIRAVTSEDAMTADWAHLPYDLLKTISNRIINEVQGVNRVVYDISSKPPATIEWE